jgi:hypothetical protein
MHLVQKKRVSADFHTVDTWVCDPVFVAISVKIAPFHASELLLDLGSVYVRCKLWIICDHNVLVRFHMHRFLPDMLSHF